MSSRKSHFIFLFEMPGDMIVLSNQMIQIKTANLGYFRRNDPKSKSPYNEKQEISLKKIIGACKIRGILFTENQYYMFVKIMAVSHQHTNTIAKH